MKHKDLSTAQASTPKNKGSPDGTTNVGDISGGKGFAIGPGAKSFVIEIGSLLNFATIFEFIQRNWVVLIINIVLQGTVITLWLNFANRFLIPIWILITAIILTETAILTFPGGKTLRHRSLRFVLFSTSFLALIGVSAFEYMRIMHPSKFLPDDFGVAVAQFGEGPDFNNSANAREVSQIVLEQLTKQAQQNPDLDFVQFKPIGLIKTQEEASEDGMRIGADLVIWGQLQVSENQTLLHFSILETPDKVSNPMFPRVLPLYDVAASSFFRIGGQESNDITKGTTALSAFIFGLANFFERNFSEATRAFDEALDNASYEREDDYHYLIYFYNGLTLQRINKLEEANTQFLKAISIHSNDPAPWVGLAFDNNSLGKSEEAQKQAQTAYDLYSKRIGLHPDDYISYFNRAQAGEIIRDWDSVLADYQTARDKAPDLYIAYIGIARINIIMNRYQEAIQSCEEAIQLAEGKGANPAWAYIYLGHTYHLIGDSSNTRFAFNKAVELAPEVDYMHFRLAQYLESTGDINDLAAAEEEYRSCVVLSDNKAWAYSVLADFLAKQNRLDEAGCEYRNALQHDPQAVAIRLNYADVLERLGRSAEALDAYHRAIETDPDDLYARLSFGTFLFTQGQYESAIREWETARQIDPSNCDLLLNLGQAYELSNCHEQAKAVYLDASSLEAMEDQECRNEATRRLIEYPP